MGHDDKGKGAKETLVEEGRALVGKVYDDAAKPAVGQVGKTLGLAVEVALSPMNLILGGVKVAVDRLSAAIERKLSGIAPDRLLPPPATIAAPAAWQYALLGDGDEVAALREMFENLLVASMDRDTASSAHPAFVSMISQLTPDEARILKSIDRDEYALIDMYGEDQSWLGFRTRLGIGAGIDETKQQLYLWNLDRLGIISISEAGAADSDERDALLAAIEAEFPGHGALSTEGSIVLTPLSRQFLDTCVRVRRR